MDGFVIGLGCLGLGTFGLGSFWFHKWTDFSNGFQLESCPPLSKLGHGPSPHLWGLEPKFDFDILPEPIHEGSKGYILRYIT